MSTKLGMAALLATGMIGMAVVPASADKGPNNIELGVEGDIEAVCSYGDPIPFPAAIKEVGDHGLHNAFWFKGAESWLACNGPAWVKTTVTATTPHPEGTLCGVSVVADDAALDGSAASTCDNVLELEKYSEIVAKKSVGQWYTVHFAGKPVYEGAPFSPLAKGYYKVVLTQTATPD